jgi:hypothetical protein
MLHLFPYRICLALAPRGSSASVLLMKSKTRLHQQDLQRLVAPGQGANAFRAEDGTVYEETGTSETER